jgi:PAS domain-containing protein
MTIRCTWCNNEIPPEQAGSASENRVTRGICAACREHFAFQMGVPLQSYLDSLPVPIFVVDGQGVVQNANRTGYTYLQKKPEQVMKKLGGVVFECAYARLPEGCGRTVHCTGCAIRRSVAQTYETGQRLVGVPALMHCGRAGEEQDIAMRISTEMLGDIVLLRLDSAVQSVGA